VVGKGFGSTAVGKRSPETQRLCLNSELPFALPLLRPLRLLLLLLQVSAADQAATLLSWQCSSLPVPSSGSGQVGASRWEHMAQNPGWV